MNRKSFLVASLGALLWASSSAFAQTAPTRPVTLFVSAAQGVTYNVLRAMVEKVKENTGATIILEARPGGAGVVALQALKHASNDGHTIGSTAAAAMTIAPFTQKELGIDPLKDFVPITQLQTIAALLAAPETFAAKNLSEAIEMSKAKPQSVRVGYIGPANRVWLAIMSERSGARFLEVQFKNGADAMVQALGGNIDMWFDLVGTVVAQPGRVKAIAHGDSKRPAQLPSVQLVREAVPGLDMISWIGVLGPAGLGADRAAWFQRELGRALRDPKITEMSAKVGLDPLANTPDEFARALRSEIETNQELIRKNNIQG